MTETETNKKIPGLWFILLLICGFAAVLARCYYLQYCQYDEYKSRADRQQLKIIENSARRGMILDRKGRILVASRMGYSIAIDPKVMEDKRSDIDNIAGPLDLDSEELYQEFMQRKDQRFMYVKRDVSKEIADQVRNLGIQGVVVRQEFFREYPMGSVAPAVLGITDSYNAGLEGLELQYDKYLCGVPGRTLYRMDVLRRPVGPHTKYESTEAKDGYNLVITIDSVIQGYAQEALKQTCEKFHARDAVCIVMVPQTGEILACANYPDFDIAMARDYPVTSRKNNAINLTYEPGSIFKPISIACGVNKKVININTVIDCLQGPFRQSGLGRISEYKNYFGKITVTEILAKSSNIGTAKIALMTGKDYLHDMIGNFGFGKKTYVDLPGEEIGIFPDEWTDKNYTFTRSSFGQGISVTPLQLLRAFCAIANGGKLVRPFVASGITDDKGVVENFRKFSLPVFNDVALEVNDSAAQVISKDCSEQMIKALVQTVEDGTGEECKLDNWTVFGKTGTANVPKTDGRGYEDYKWNVSFVAGAPVSDPKICILVTVREPDRSLGFGYTGGKVAAPAAKEVLEHTLAYLMVEPDRKTDDK